MSKIEPNSPSGQVRSVRSECLTCTFNASCRSTSLSQAQVPAFAGSSVRDRKKKGGGEGVRGGGTACTGGYKGVRAVRPEWVAGEGWFEVLWNLECLVGFSQRDICAHFNERNLTQFGRSAEKERIVELRGEI